MTKNKYITISCIHFKQGKYDLVIFALNSTILWDILSINRREEDKDKGYQRMMSPSRVRSIKKYIENENPIPTSLLVTFDNAELTDRRQKNSISTLKIPYSNDAGWIIDGQHRLIGAHESNKDIIMPVVAILDLNLKEQIRQFTTINSEARGVPSSLYYDLLKHLPIENPKKESEDKAADMAKTLKSNEDSVFYSRIVSTTSPKKGQISTTTFVRKIAPLILEGRALSVYSHLERTGILENYYRGLKNVFPKEFNKPESIFFKTLGFGALTNVLAKILSMSIAQYGSFKVEDITKLFNSVNDFDFNSWSKRGTGNKAEMDAAEDLKTEIDRAYEDMDIKSIIL